MHVCVEVVGLSPGGEPRAMWWGVEVGCESEKASLTLGEEGAAVLKGGLEGRLYQEKPEGSGKYTEKCKLPLREHLPSIMYLCASIDSRKYNSVLYVSIYNMWNMGNILCTVLLWKGEYIGENMNSHVRYFS